MAALSSPVLVARAEELALLASCLEAPPALAVVEGEAGIGKTRLVTELLAQPGLAGRRVLVGQCHPLREPFPLGPVIDALRGLADTVATVSLSPLAGALRPVLPELAPFLPPLPDPLPEHSMVRHRLWRAVVELLGALGPAVVVLEDLHWADDATAEFLAFLVVQMPPGLSLVLTWRSEDLAPASPLSALSARLPAATMRGRVVLAPLTPEQVQALVRSILASDQVSDEFAIYLHERTGGVPFAVEEVLRLLQDRHDLIRLEGGWSRRALDALQVPAAVRESILERLVRLPESAQRMVQAAAVVEVAADEDLLAAVAGLAGARSRAHAGLVIALESALLQGTGDHRYGLRHALAAEAIYGAIAAPSRRRLHQRAARVLEASAEASLAHLARHYREAGQPRKWGRYARAAAEHAAFLGDHGAAAGFLIDALSAPRQPRANRAEMALLLCTAAANGMVQGEAIAVVREVIEAEPLLSHLRGQLRFNLAALLHQGGDASAARTEMEHAVAELAWSPTLQARAMGALALPWVLEGRLGEHLEWMDRAAGLTEQPAGDRAAVLLAVGDPAGWPAVPHPPPEGAPAEAEQQWLVLCTNLAVNTFYLGHYRRSREFAADGIRISERLGYPRMLGALTAVTVLLDWAGGRWDGLEDRADRLLGPHVDVPSAVQAEVVLGLLRLAAGAQEEAEKVLTAGVERAARAGAIPTMAMAAAGLARLRLARGEAGAAQASALSALEVVAGKGVWAWAVDVAPVAVECLVARGRIDEATDWARRIEEGIQGRDAPAARAALAECRASLAEAAGDIDQADRGFADAVDAWTELACPYPMAKMLERRGNLLIGREREAGCAVLLDALASYARLGAAWDEKRVRRVLRRHNVSLPQPTRRGRKGFGDELSPREREVVELASIGLTSTRIAQRLFLSPRTVDHHLARAMRKMGVSSRKSLVAARDDADRK